MSPTICGRDMNANKANFVYGTANRCDVTSIASPDNIEFDNVRGHLLISEDTSYHQNDATWVVWMLDMESFDINLTLLSLFLFSTILNLER